MSAREFGPYLLLHRLSEDSLCDTYRAGLKSGDDVERVVLLCLFKVSGEDVEWIAETAAVGTRALAGLESPHLADIVASGEIDGRAFLAYDFIPGISLSRLLEESRRESLPIPPELSLLIVDRAAKGLTAAWDHESRMLHGFLTPPLLMISNEGEIRLLGFEVASRLRRLLTEDDVGAELGRYLPPEIVPFGQPATTDDVYSLGAILFDLLTGERPPAVESQLESAVGNATLVDGSALADDVRELLATSLGPPQRRLPLQAWSQKLSDIVLSGRHEGTSFNLALFLHRLFGDSLEKGAPVVERSGLAAAPSSESAIDALVEQLRPVDEEPDATGLPVEPEVETEAPLFTVDDDTELSPEAPTPRDDPSEDVAAPLLVAKSTAKPRSRYFAVAGSIIVLLGVILVLTLYTGDEPPRRSTADSTALQPLARPGANEPIGAEPFPGVPGELAAVGPDGAETEDDSTVSTPEDTGASTTQRPAAAERKTTVAAATPPQRTRPASPPPESESRTSTGAASTRTTASPSTDRSSTALTAGTGRPDSDAPTRAEPTVATGSAPDRPAEGSPTAPSVASPPDLDPAPGSTALDTPAADPPADADAPAQPASTLSGLPADPTRPETGSASSEPTTRPEAAPAVETPEDAGEPPASPQMVEPAEPAPVEPVREGDLASRGPGVVGPSLVRSVQPSFPALAMRLKKEAVVEFKVLVDENGEAAEVEQVGEPAGFGFDEAALRAVRRMGWEPATKDGVRVKMWTRVRVEFQP